MQRAMILPFPTTTSTSASGHQSSISATAAPARRRGRRVQPEPQHPRGLSPRSTLSEAYQRWARPLLAEELKPASLEQYDAAVRHWVQLTGDPPLETVHSETCRRFVTQLKRRPGLKGLTLSPATVCKVCVHLGKLFDLLGLQTRRRPEAIDELGLWGWRWSEMRRRWVRRRPPRLPVPRAVGEEPEPLTIEEIGRAMDAARHIGRPLIPGCSPEVFLAALVWWSYAVGTRLSTTLKLRWDWLDGHWVRVPRQALKGERRACRFWVSEQARQAIEPLKASGTGLIFPWPCSEDYLKKRLARIQDLARIPVRGRFGLLHRCRQALATWLMTRNPAVAKLQLGHSLARDVALRHYTDPGIVRELMEQLPRPPVPEWFAGEKQLRLF